MVDYVIYMIIGIGIGFAAGFLVARALLKTRLADMEEKFSLQFENLANRIFDEKTDRFKKESREDLGNLLNPLRERLQEFQKKIDDSFGTQMREQISLKEEIRHIVSVNEKMSQQTENLTRALRGDVKAQGNWGEVMLEKILEAAGLREGIEYTTQGGGQSLRHIEDGGVLKPDVMIMLPEDKHIIIDSKVSLTSYERYCGTEDAGERALFSKEYLASVRTHVTGLSGKRYQDAAKGTPDFVLMFMPIEGAFSLALQEDPSLHSFAWEKKIVIVCPSTLFATLRTVESVWRLERQNRNTLEIARRGSLLYDKVAGFVDTMQDLGKKIDATQKTYDDAFKKLSTGTGNIIRQTEELKTLGVKAGKSLPKDLLDAGQVEDFKKAENG
ncbi:MAG: DNA recombination protein RmuC [Alphaproteobacteria bacterium]|nr:DNA recombination protein RmuC [Alphaproteobacteria bacterium]